MSLNINECLEVNIVGAEVRYRVKLEIFIDFFLCLCRIEIHTEFGLIQKPNEKREGREKEERKKRKGTETKGRGKREGRE